jgi:hypothetical protein
MKNNNESSFRPWRSSIGLFGGDVHYLARNHSSNLETGVKK